MSVNGTFFNPSESMMDELLIGFALDALPANEHAQAQTLLAENPLARQRLAQLRAQLAILEVDLVAELPPPNLSANTIAFTAQYLLKHGEWQPEEWPEPSTTHARHEPPPTQEMEVPRVLHATQPSSEGPIYFSRSRANVLVLAAAVLLSIGLFIPAVQKLRERAQMASCQNHLRELHASLSGYSETHEGHFPQVGTLAVPHAGAFAEELMRSGQTAVNFKPFCPSNAEANTHNRYAYTLGYWGNRGELVGPRMPREHSDVTPIASDLPNIDPNSLAQRSHNGGWNVLYMNGAVRYTNVPKIGENGDNIFKNDAGFAGAGLHSSDTCLGRPHDRP